VLAGGFEELRARALDDQLTAYPRKLRINMSPGYNVGKLERMSGFFDMSWEMPERSLTFRLRCENEDCANPGGHFESDFIYELEVATTFESYFLPKTNDETAAKRFFDAAEISGMTSGLEDAFKTIVEDHVWKQHAALAIKLGLTCGGMAHPIFAVAFIIAEEAVERAAAKLQQDKERKEANLVLWQKLIASPYQVKDVGGPGHVQFGELLRYQELGKRKHVQKSFGGLTKWMDPDSHRFGWVCPEDAYRRIAVLKGQF
jgi:hypothetical protein